MSPASASAAAGNNRPICTICYEDLKTITEDLQVIPNCGHVFHELCLQQWLEYCPAGKRPTCPFCKQPCAHTHPTRLFFQSTGDPTQVPSSPDRHSSEPDAEALAEEVRKLEAKLSSLASTFENQQTHLKKLNDELSTWKDLAKAEEAKKEQMRKEKELAEQYLQIKMTELSRKSSECSKLEQRSLGLAKELAALKLATDLNLGEDEMAKLASLGHGGNPENAIDVMRKSLALRNKSYKELMAQCNLLGRTENRTSQKLEKAKEKIQKLKTRLQEVEKILEERENGILRDLKVSYKSKAEGAHFSRAIHNLEFSDFRSHSMDDQTGIKELGKTLAGKEYGIASYKSKAEGASFSCAMGNLEASCHNSMEGQTGKPAEAFTNINQISSSRNQTSYLNRNVNVTEHQKDLTSSVYKENNCADLESDSRFLSDKDILELSPNSYRPRTTVSIWQNKNEFQKNTDDPLKLSISENGAASFPSDQVASSQAHIRYASGPWNSGIDAKNVEKAFTETSVLRKETHLTTASLATEKLHIDSKHTPSLVVTKEAEVHDPVACSGDSYLPGRRLGLESTNRSMGMWSRHSNTKASSFTAPTSTSNGSLIAVGADGRGGRVKVLRTHDRLLDGKAQTLWPKRQKHGVKQNGQSQIEHFFGRTGN